MRCSSGYGAGGGGRGRVLGGCCFSYLGTMTSVTCRAQHLCTPTHLIAIFVLQVPPADGALARRVRGIWTFLGSTCDTTFNLGGREREPVKQRAVWSL